MTHRFIHSLAKAILAIVIITGASSCVREYTCNCTISYSGRPGMPDTLNKQYKIKDMKATAEKLCKDGSNTSEKDGITTTEKCALW